MKIRLSIPLFPTLLSIMLLLLSGCSSIPVNSQALAPTELNVIQQHPYSVNVAIKGRATGVAFVAASNEEQVSRELMAKAIEQTIKAKGIFSAIADKSNADYLLEVTLYHIEHKQIEVFTIVKTFKANWHLKERRSKKTKFQKMIVTKGTATTDDTMSGNRRATIAIERAAQANIKEGLSKLTALKL